MDISRERKKQGTWGYTHKFDSCYLWFI